MAVVGNDEISAEAIRQSDVSGMTERLLRATTSRAVHETNFGAMAPFTTTEFQQRRDNLRSNAALLAPHFRMSGQHGDLPRFR
jgi:hypothetical protein